MAAPDRDRACRARQLLGIRADATIAEINIAYRRLVRGLHPDTARPGAPPSATLAEAQAARDLLRTLAQAIHHHDPPPIRPRHDLHPRARRHTPDLRAGPVRYHGPARVLSQEGCFWPDTPG
jgi:hypothetical protein